MRDKTRRKVNSIESELWKGEGDEEKLGKRLKIQKVKSKKPYLRSCELND